MGCPPKLSEPFVFFPGNGDNYDYPYPGANNGEPRPAESVEEDEEEEEDSGGIFSNFFNRNNDEADKPEDPCAVGEWSEWSQCSGTCRPASRHRTHEYLDPE